MSTPAMVWTGPDTTGAPPTLMGVRSRTAARRRMPSVHQPRHCACSFCTLGLDHGTPVDRPPR